MKKLLLAAVLVSTFAFTSCTKSKKAQCEAAMDKVIDLTLNSPQMKKMMENPAMKAQMAKMKDGMKAQMAKKVDECVKDFNADSISCIMSLSNLQDIGKCDLKKKK